MKKSLLIASAVVAAVLFGCKEDPYINAPGDNSKNYDTIPILQADTNGIIISVDSALSIGAGLVNDQLTPESYKISGTIANIVTNLNDIPGKYTNVNFDLKDDSSEKTLRCQYTNNINNYPFRSNAEVPRAGSKVTVMGPMSKYNGTPQMKNGFIVRVDSLATEEEGK